VALQDGEGVGLWLMGDDDFYGEMRFGAGGSNEEIGSNPFVEHFVELVSRTGRSGVGSTCCQATFTANVDRVGALVGDRLADCGVKYGDGCSMER
jgi:hypothetical protein